MPLYDADTRMLFLAGKADVGIMYWEVAEKEPYLTEGLKHNGQFPLPLIRCDQLMLEKFIFHIT